MYHIVLDLDGTLIATDANNNPCPRPFLYDFLIFCFENFKSVSIWTAANFEWLNVIMKEILEPFLRNTGHKFRFTWTHEMCDKRYEKLVFTPYHTDSYNFVYVKSLKKAWNKYLDMNKGNTIIIDDNIYSSLDNLENSFEIKPWKYDDYVDNELKNLMNSLKKLLFHKF